VSGSLTGKARAALRSSAHHLDPIAHIGQQGITPAVLRGLEDALLARELVKISVGRNATMSARDAAPQLAEQLGAEVIQVIGRTVSLYRKREEGDE
jgi:RNA-binding protein